MKPLKTSILMTVALFATFALTACPSPDPNTDPGPEQPDAGHVVRCGDNVCEGSETAASCPADCHTATQCGNGVCETGESASSCPADCHSVAQCGNSVCETGESASTCPQDCSVCGDGVCTGGETGTTCPADCDAKLKVTNESTYTIFYLYAAQCGASTWSSDQLGSHTIIPNAAFTLTGVPPGCWYFKAEASNGTPTWTSAALTLTAGETFNWNLFN